MSRFDVNLHYLSRTAVNAYQRLDTALPFLLGGRFRYFQ